MKVRILTRPLESEVDGVSLNGFMVGSVRDVSISLGSWLVAQGYAQLEMRSGARAQSEPATAPFAFFDLTRNPPSDE